MRTFRNSLLPKNIWFTFIQRIRYTIQNSTTNIWDVCLLIDEYSAGPKSCYPPPSINVTFSKLCGANYVKEKLNFFCNKSYITQIIQNLKKKFKMMCKIDTNICEVW